MLVIPRSVALLISLRLCVPTIFQEFEEDGNRV